MASETTIANLALQKLGAKRVTLITDANPQARSARACYEHCRDIELAKYVWTFAVARASIAADATAPDWGRARSFQLPSDYIRLAPNYSEDVSPVDKDWVIEGRKIYTNDSDPLYVRYVQRVEDVNRMHPLFREVVACSMALQMCEEITQSNPKKSAAMDDYRKAVREARAVQAIEKGAVVLPDSEWTTERYR